MTVNIRYHVSWSSVTWKAQAGVIGRPFPRSRRSFLLRAKPGVSCFPLPESAPFPFRSFRLGPARPLWLAPGSAAAIQSVRLREPGVLRLLFPSFSSLPSFDPQTTSLLSLVNLTTTSSFLDLLLHSSYLTVLLLRLDHP